MEDVLRPVPAEDGLHMRGVGDAGDYGEALYLRELPGHHQPYVVHGGLCLVDEYHLLGTVNRCLADHFASDGTGGSGDEYPASAELSAYRVHIDLYLVPRQQVLDIHFVQLLVGYVPAVPDLVVDHHYPDALGDEFIHHLGIGPDHVGLERGHEQHLHSLCPEPVGEAFLIEIHRLAHKVHTLHLFPVGNECAERILFVIDRGDALGQSYSAHLRSVYGNGQGSVQMEGVVEQFDHHPFDPEQQGADRE